MEREGIVFFSTAFSIISIRAADFLEDFRI